MLPYTKAVPYATILLLCFTVGQLASLGWWVVQTAEQVTCQIDNEGVWSIGVYKGSTPFSLQPLERLEPGEHSAVAWPVANPVLTCASLGDTPSNFVADPFLWQHEDGLYMFYETKSTTKRRGEIGVARSTDGGVTFRHLGVALSEPWHLSYPFVFEHRGQVYMLPEASASGQLRLYRATGFPLGWQLDSVLLDRPLVDASLVEYGGQWWMFASDPSRRGAALNGELEVWYADSPLGPWEQHAANPVMNGARQLGARSGGRPLVYEGRLFRFGQDCGETYGHKVVAFEVTKLSPTEFEQVPVDLGIAMPSSSSSKKGAWNSRRQHHIDVQQLPSGEWVAALDGDSVPSGFVSRQLVRTAALALGPWLALLAAWASIRVVAQRSLRARHLLYANTYVPVLMMGRHGVPPIKIKRDEDLEDSADEWQQNYEWHERGQEPDVLKAEHGKRRGSKWWPLRRDLLRRRGSVGSLEGQQKGPAAPASSAASGGLPFGASLQRLRPAALALVALLLLGAGLCAALGGALYLRPYLLPYRALAVEGQYSQFTLVSMSYDARMSTLRHMVRHYSRCPSVAEIVLVWNKGQPPVPERDFDSAVPVRVRLEPLNSLNNRFKMDPQIRTRAVLSLDDDIMMPCADIERAFAVWRTQPEKMVGFYPRLIEGSPLEFRGERYSIERGVYNAVLTGAAFLDTWTAFPAYWEESVRPARETVDRVFNGEDLLMNFVLANRTRHLGAGEGSMRRRQRQQLGGEQQRQGSGRSMADAGSPAREGAAEEEVRVQYADSAVYFVPPSRRVDISKLSGVGISHNFQRFKDEAQQYLANFTATFGYMPLQPHSFDWDKSAPPFCALDFLGCTYVG